MPTAKPTPTHPHDHRKPGAASAALGRERSAADHQPFFTAGQRLWIVGLLLVAALGIRAYRLTDLPMDFHAARQYRSAIIARSYYFKTADSVPEWRKKVAEEAARRQGLLEPPVMEWLTAWAYRLTGGERLWIPRILSSVFWLVGGVFLYRLAASLMSADGAVASTAFYLFLPFAVSASRSFQPDPLMVMLLVWSIHAIVRCYHQPARHGLITAAVVSALAMFVKPVCAFPIVAVYLLLAVETAGLSRTLRSRRVWFFLVGVLAPTVAYYAYGTFIAGFLRGQAGGSFLPKLLVDPLYWRGWLDKIWFVMGYSPLVAGILGIFLCRAGIPRTTMGALWAGYVLLGLVFTYHIHTHDYYHLVLIPVVALSLAPVVGSLLQRLDGMCSRRSARVVAMVVLGLAVVSSMDKASWRRTRRSPEAFLATAEAVGQAVNHSHKTIVLSPESGKPLTFHAEIAGVKWPTRNDLVTHELRGKPMLTARQRLDGLIAAHGSEYFIVTFARELSTQEGLKQLLTSEFPVIARGRYHQIFDLRPR